MRMLTVYDLFVVVVVVKCLPSVCCIACIPFFHPPLLSNNPPYILSSSMAVFRSMMPIRPPMRLCRSPHS